jgi:5-methylcytosine-specific restriction endonuclease McrA
MAIKERRKEYQKIKPRLHLLLIERDGHKCKQCNSIENIQIDHIIPLSKGGSDEPENLQLLCRKCNIRKGDK